jgi:hypothetical protein
VSFVQEREIDRLDKENAALRAENEALRRDAERYRWVRNHIDMECGIISFEYDDYYDAERLDAAVAAAIERERSGK